MQLFLDCDGVLANFKGYASEVLGRSFEEYEYIYGLDLVWYALECADDFYYRLPVLQEGQRLYDAVKYLNPIILTGCPDDAVWSREQKIRWGKKYFPEAEMITVPSPDKRNYSSPGDILIDDYLKYRDRWIEWGGIFIHYQNTDQALKELSPYLTEIIE